MEAGHLPLIFEWCWLGHVTFNKGICIFIESFLGQEHPDVAELSLKHPDLFAGCFRRLAVNKFIIDYLLKYIILLMYQQISVCNVRLAG